MSFQLGPGDFPTENLTVERSGDSLVFTKKWSASWYSLPIFFLILTSVVFLIARDMHSNPSTTFRDWALLTIFFGGGDLLVLYVLVASFCNTTRIEVSDAKLIVKHFPLPALGLALNSSDIKKVYCYQLPMVDPFNKPSFRWAKEYKVYALLKDGRRREILHLGTSKDEALSLAAEIQNALGLPRTKAPLRSHLNS